MTLQTIPLAKLDRSAANVRKPGAAPIDALAESIASSGLLNNLVVRPHLRDDGIPTDRDEVVADGRRLQKFGECVRVDLTSVDLVPAIASAHLQPRSCIAQPRCEDPCRSPVIPLLTSPSADETVQGFLS